MIYGTICESIIWSDKTYLDMVDLARKYYEKVNGKNIVDILNRIALSKNKTGLNFGKNYQGAVELIRTFFMNNSDKDSSIIFIEETTDNKVLLFGKVSVLEDNLEISKIIYREDDKELLEDICRVLITVIHGYALNKGVDIAYINSDISINEKYLSKEYKEQYFHNPSLKLIKKSVNNGK